MDALEFLGKAAKAKRQPVYVLHGEEDFLRRQARTAAVDTAIENADPSLAVTSYAGSDKLSFSTIRNELSTLPFLSPCRVVVIENADPFVTAQRPALEEYVQAPARSGVLILEVKSFPETTRLAKALPDGAKIACKAPQAYRMAPWATKWSQERYGKKLPADAAELLVELAGQSLGLLDQELNKLSVAVGPAAAITARDVEAHVGRSKAADVFRILDMIGEGKPGEALQILEMLFADGADPMGILGPLTFQLRRLAAVGRLVSSGQSLQGAMDAAGVPAWEKRRQGIERQVRHLGRRRLDRLVEWLLEINVGLKGSNPLPERVQVERLIVRLARPREEGIIGPGGRK